MTTLTATLLGFTLLLSLTSALFAATLSRKHSKASLRKELRELSDRIDELDATIERRWNQVKTERATRNVQAGRARKLAEHDQDVELEEAQRQGPMAMLRYNMRKNGLG